MENIFCLESHIHLCSRHTSAIPAYVIKICVTWHAISGTRYWVFVSPKLHVSTYRNQQHCWWFHYLSISNCSGAADEVWEWADHSLQWCNNGFDGVSNHQPHHCLLSRLFGRRSKKTWKLCVTGLCAGNSPGTGEFPAQMASNAYVTNSNYNDVIMGLMASQITSLTIVYSAVYSGADQRKHESSASLAFVRGFPRDRWIPRTNGQ